MKRCSLGLALAASLLCTNALASPEYHQSRLNALDNELVQMMNEFSVRSQSIRTPALNERLAEGISLQAAGDHQRAGYVFMDIVSRDAWRSYPGYQTAQLQLARSLYEGGYYRMAQRHLIDLLKNGSGSERTDGVMLLLQVAQRTGDWTEVNTALAGVTDFSRTPAYLYIMGRAMFLQGDNDIARTCLEAVSGNDEWSIKATYLLGVLDILDANIESALTRFKSVADNKTSYRDSDKVRTLAILAQARLYYEQSMWSEAIDCYQRVSENSLYFPAVLYEMGWTQIRLENYQSAQQSFELLLLSYPEDSHALETRRLLADIKRQLGQYDDAVASYQQIVNEFEPVMTQMEQESADLNAKKAQLKQKIEAEEFHNVELVPQNAKGLVAVGTDVNKVEVMLNSLTESDANTIESEIIMAEIAAILASESNMQNLPEFQQFTQHAQDIRISALLTGFEFTEEYSGAFDTHVKTQLEEIAKLPRTTRERAIMNAVQLEEREEREARLHRLKLEADSMRHKTQILRSWIDGGKTASLTDEEKNNLSSQLVLFETQLSELKMQQDAIESNLARIRSMNGESETEIQNRQQNIDNLYAALNARWSQDMSSANADYRALIESERTLMARLDNFNGDINASLRERVEMFKARLEREAEFVEAEKSRYLTVRSDVGEAAGEISARYWQSVYEQIRDMVLNADLGIVDIAWLQKDARSKALSATMEERKKEREILEQNFRQFLQESGQE